MDLSKILSITGKNGLFKLISQTKTNFIVEALSDGKRFAEFSHTGVAILDNISIYTEDEDLPLTKVFQLIYQKEEGKPIAEISGDKSKLKSYFEEVLPNYDKERVYVSNIKKVLQWYNILIEHQLIDLVEEESKDAEEDKGEVVEEDKE
ncbi:MAG TPA: DUF5606 domain-containing protein [Bacteroidales bacterium]|nr:DUF5606 domain-containing protein [Bacteroidales bacterium]HOS57879.1 DUF5606 domain-containing protein [Bacteroidales bacterium]HRT12984.1 DUF5606 domain-containing protein [Bacteroidales bacterium]